jgi:hypothetical protein
VTRLLIGNWKALRVAGSQADQSCFPPFWRSLIRSVKMRSDRVATIGVALFHFVAKFGVN